MKALLRAALVVVAVVASTVVVPPAPAALAMPATPIFGPAIEGYQANDPQDTCENSDKPGPVDLRELLDATYGQASWSIGRPCQSWTSEHFEGRALDWFTDVRTERGRAVANDIINWLLRSDVHGNAHANFRRLGLMYIIWNRQIWSGYHANEGWRPYACDGTPTDCHENHIHFSFGWDGAYRRTSWWTGRITLPTIAPSTVSPIMHGSLLRVFMRAADNTLLQRYWDGANWTWQGLGGTITSGPSAVIENGVLRVFARGNDGALWRNSLEGSTWRWEKVGGQLSSHPSAIYFGGQLRVFYRGSNGHLYQAYYSGGWHFDDFGHVVQSGPSVINENGTMRVFFRGEDGALWRTSLEGGAWRWQRIGGLLSSSPGVLMQGGQIFVFARGADGALWRFAWTGSAWQQNKVGGSIGSGPQAVMHDAVPRVFFKGADNQLWQAFYESGDWRWQDLGGNIV